MHPEPPLVRFGRLRRRTNPAARHPSPLFEATASLAQAPTPSDASGQEQPKAMNRPRSRCRRKSGSITCSLLLPCCARTMLTQETHVSGILKTTHPNCAEHSEMLACTERRNGQTPLPLSRQPRREPTVAPESMTIHRAPPVRPNPSFKPSTNGAPRGPGRRYPVHFRQPGPRGTPLVPS